MIVGYVRNGFIKPSNYLNKWNISYFLDTYEEVENIKDITILDYLRILLDWTT